ncbi:hypothetical protein IB642_06470 [Allofrancisella guangzhouensis]|uniref:Uncharacterized protein n=1 Tax=Allofrancisella guangzhouensis TaxID=594679 RepID=A0A0A8EAW5_9GAMM|nr:PhoPQ-activated protein PqaA family protein [Allofrancisella guangzhouensis]AJC49326.1 hypothetical protein SD28_06660 [Allofrancisella guangzhouensis]MBK2027229.1 hypothetical protein [Allofrancisella guangzhouensis]MBK2044665.1 hypothetical protein [Allofrancisella guangzhouensis]MBK2045052.1 hypothetical protein [Allofrancisella guangzhouensis]
MFRRFFLFFIAFFIYSAGVSSEISNSEICNDHTELLKPENQHKVLNCAKEVLYQKPELLKELPTIKVDGTNTTMYQDIISTVKWPWYSKDNPKSFYDLPSTTWEHLVQVYVPKNVSSDTAIIQMYLGENPIIDRDYAKPNDKFAKLAEKTKSVVIRLYQIPNQPLEGLPLFQEDFIIAYTWDKFLKNPNKYLYFPLHIPMSVATIETMDWITEMLKNKGINIQKFILSGESKRGWTTWMTSLMDNRVTGIIPVVINILNAIKQFDNINNFYGQRWPFAMLPYYIFGLTNFKNFTEKENQNMHTLINIIDPYSYIDDSSFKSRTSIPKYIINASGDDFFLPDGTYAYFSRLNGDQNLQRSIVNSGHRTFLAPDLFFEGYDFFISHLDNNEKLPTLDTKIVKKENYYNFDITYKCPNCAMTGIEATLYLAKNHIARDFRYTCMTRYQAIKDPLSKAGIYMPIVVPLNKLSSGIFQGNAKVPITSTDWQSAFIEIKYKDNQGAIIKTSTPTQIIEPDNTDIGYAQMPQDIRLIPCLILPGVIDTLPPTTTTISIMILMLIPILIWMKYVRGFIRYLGLTLFILAISIAILVIRYYGFATGTVAISLLLWLIVFTINIISLLLRFLIGIILRR